MGIAFFYRGLGKYDRGLPESVRIDFVYFDAGGGHRSAATALQAAIAAEGRDWDVRLLNLQEVLDPLDVFRKVTSIRLEDLYNRMLARGWTIGADYWLPIMQRVIRMNHSGSVALLNEVWRERRPHMVVSLIPNLNRALFESLQQTCPHVPLVTILTDVADYPPHFWMEKQAQYFVCGSPRAVQQAKDLGVQPWQIIRVSGMILRPNFYQQPPIDRREERRRLGLDPDLPTGLVLFGGEGSNVMYALAERLGNSKLDLQLIMLCGRNEKLRTRLKAMKTRNRVFAEGFTKEIPYYMQLADFFIGKPGPGSISEALHMNLPVILESNAWTLPQERYNAEWVRDEGYGMVLGNLREVEKAVKTLLQNGELARLKSKISRLQNNAVFEIPPILERILAKAQNEVSPAFPARSGADTAGSTRGELADRDLSRS